MLLFLGCAEPVETAELIEHSGETGTSTVEIEAQTDVIVVGGGPTGVAAAIAADEAGAEVVLFERGEKLGQGVITAGLCFAAGSRLQAQTGIEDSADDAAADWMDITGVDGESESVRQFLDGSADTVDWLAEHGVAIDGVIGGDDAGPVERLHVLAHPAGEEPSILGFLGNTDARVSTEVSGLLQRGGEVVGVAWTEVGSGETHTLGGRVVVATGGWARGNDALARFRPDLDAAGLLYEANYGSDGGGLPLLDAVGADWILPENIGIYVHSTQDPTQPDGEALTLFGIPSGVLVGADGARFVDESLMGSLALFEALPDGPTWLLLGADEAGVSFMRPQYNWADPYTAEALDVAALVAGGVGVQAEDVAGLALATGLDADALQVTVDRWNAAVDAGADADFGRDLEGAVRLDPPLTAVPILPGTAKNFGGVATSLSAEVLDGAGAPVPGLWAAGEVAGMLLGGGAGRGFSGSVCGCYQGGRIAGEQAAAR